MLTDEQRLHLWAYIEAWRYCNARDSDRTHDAINDYIDGILAQARAEAFEECAKMVEDFNDKFVSRETGLVLSGCVYAIRARKDAPC